MGGDILYERGINTIQNNTVQYSTTQHNTTQKYQELAAVCDKPGK